MMSMTYQTVKILKESEKSTISLVIDAESGRMMVEKRLSSELSIYQRLMSLPHPFLPQLYDVHLENGKTVIVEEYISGGSIAEINASEKQLSAWLLELCQVLNFLHRNKIIHRDIKPSNLLIGNDGHIRLIDFDAAREEKPDAQTDTRMLGTRGYAPPEQYGFAQTDNRADIYALGITFRSLLGNKANKLRWRRILKRCTALEPKRRYRNVQQITMAIRYRQIRPWVLIPLTAVGAVFILYWGIIIFLAFAIDGNISDTADVVHVVLSKRYTTFRFTDIEAMKNSTAALSEYEGDQQDVYDLIYHSLPQDQLYISTGYCDETGHLLFGGFMGRYNVSQGKCYFGIFTGLYAATPEGQTDYYHISADECEPYAPAVMMLYHLDVFDGGWGLEILLSSLVDYRNYLRTGNLNLPTYTAFYPYGKRRQGIS